MVGLTNNVKVTIVRNAAGIYVDRSYKSCNSKSVTYPPHINLKSPSNCGSNTQALYDPDKRHNVRQIMNFFDAPSTNYTPYYRTNIDNALSFSYIPIHGEHIIVIWTPLTVIENRDQLVRYLSTRRV